MAQIAREKEPRVRWTDKQGQGLWGLDFGLYLEGSFEGFKAESKLQGEAIGGMCTLKTSP